jgi:hypothetical protein
MSEPTEPIERLRAAFAARADVPSAEECPDAERLWRAVKRDLPAEDRRALVAHTAACPSCAAAWRIARELGPRPAARMPPTRSWAPLAAAAVVVLGLGIALLVARGPGRAPQYRESATITILSLTAEDVPLPRTRCVLRWTPAPEGSRYDLRVTTEALHVVHEAQDLTSAEHLVPEVALAQLPAGTRLLWQVDVKLPQGETLQSQTFVSRIE